jgi:hypothetical protein
MRGTGLLLSCLIAERRSDQVRCAIEEYTSSLDGLLPSEMKRLK